jgi:malate permease and related proteins
VHRGDEDIDFIVILVPIFSVFIVGFLVGKIKKVDIDSLSFVAINVFYPFLVFFTFYKDPITIDFLYIFIAITLLLIGIYILIVIMSKVLNYDKKKKHAMLLAGVFMNGGNYGIPVVLFTLGEEGFVYAMMVMIIMSVYMNTVGLFIAASGANEGISTKKAFMKTIKMPIIPAIVIGVLFRIMQLKLPESVENTISFMADAAIPLIMIVLGIQLSSIVFRNIDYKTVGLLVSTRLIISPILAIAVNQLLGVNGTLLASVLIIVAAMPTAANTTIFSVNYNVEPELVSSTTLISTVLSLITLPFWLYIIQVL